MTDARSGKNAPYDLLIVGGGINGAGIARDAAGRGLRVALVEQGDLAQGTSSASTKLIHGGLRYLEYYEFSLVRKALMEREVLLAAAPHLIWPLTFVLPHDKGLRPAWMVRLGLFLYDHLGGRKRLPLSRGVDFRKDPLGAPLKETFVKGFTYADCWVEDSRLVVLNAMDARERGAEVLTRTRCESLRRENGLWRVRLQPGGGAPVYEVSAHAVVNAAGPWVRDVLAGVARANRPAGLRLVKGSHLVVPRLFEGEQAYIFQNEDRRIIFAIPYERNYTLLGTTDKAWDHTPDEKVEIDAEEAAYICTSVNRYLKTQVRPEDAVWSYSGVRPLFDDDAANLNASAVTRDYSFDIDGGEGAAPMLSIFGGKITTYRKLAEHALTKLVPLLPESARSGAGEAWTERAHLPGGDIADADFEAFMREVRQRHPWLPPELARRYGRAYGTRLDTLIGEAGDLQGLGRDLGGGLYAAEIDYLVRHEWVETADDLLWRRSKLGLHVPEGTAARVADYLHGVDDVKRGATAG